MNATASAFPVRHVDRRRTRQRDARWRDSLPADWERMAVVPARIEEYRDYEADAMRLIGHDEDGHPCFTKHRFVSRRLCSDDGEDFYSVVAYAELLTAWLLRDGRWLTHRVVVREGEIENGRGFYSLGESMPR